MPNSSSARSRLLAAAVLSVLLVFPLTHLLSPAEVSAAVTTCRPDKTITYADVEGLVKKYGLPADRKDDAEKGTNLAGIAEDFLGTIPPEMGPIPALFATLPDELGVPGFGPSNTFFTHLGGVLAVVQLGVELSKGEPMAQLNFGKNATLWYIGASTNVVKALKIASVGIVLIDYTLNSFGTALVNDRYNWWEKAFRRYHDRNYGHKPQDMGKWEELIYGKFKGDWRKFSQEGLKDFWDNPAVNAASVGMQQKGMVSLVRNMPADQQEAIRASYLKEMAPIFRNYYTWKQKKLREDEISKTQQAYDAIKEGLDEKVVFEGTVSDDSGAPLEKAEVTLFDLPPVASGAGGAFKIELRRCELYDAMLRVQAKGGVELKASYTAAGAAAPVEKIEKVALDIVSGIFAAGGGKQLAILQPSIVFALPVKTVKKLVLSPLKIELEPGRTVSVKAEVEYSDDTVEEVTLSPECAWSFDKKGILTVEKGQLSISAPPAGEETVQLLATFTKDGKVHFSEQAVTVTVKTAEMKLRLEAVGPKVLKNETAEIKVLLVLPDGTEKDVTDSASTEVKTIPDIQRRFDRQVSVELTGICEGAGRGFELVAMHSTGGGVLTSNTVKFSIHDDYAVVPCPEPPLREPYKKLLEQRELKGVFEPQLRDRPNYSTSTFCERLPWGKFSGEIDSVVPWEGAVVPKNSDVRVIYFSDPQSDPDLFKNYLNVPDIVGLSRSDAEQAFQGVDFDLSFLQPTRYDPNFPPGAVKAQGPKAGECVKKGVKVVATLNGSPDLTVPDLIGKREGEAGDIVRPLMLLLDVKKAKKWQRGYDAGVVVRQDPAAGGKPVKPGTTVTVWLNPYLPSIGMDVIPDKRSYQVGEKISFAENVRRTNRDNSYTFKWMKDGTFIRADDSFTTSFDTPGRHYVQLILESSDPNENDAIIRNVSIEYPPDPTVGIGVSPAGPYQSGAAVTFTRVVGNLADATEFRWYVNDNYVGSGTSLPYKIGGEGTYKIRLGVRRGSNFDELKAEKTISAGAETKPFGKWRNRFEASGTTANLKVCCSYWKPGYTQSQGIAGVKTVKGGWTKCRDFDTVGAVDNYDLYTGVQYDLYNTGWIAYMPAGGKKIQFRVYGFTGKGGRVEYRGTVDSPGTPVPESVGWAEKKGRAGKLQWRTEEGKSCSAWIFKTRGSSSLGSITRKSFVKGGVQELTCTDDPGDGGYSSGGDPGMGLTGGSASTAAANTIGQQFQGGGAGSSGGASSGNGSQGSQGSLSNVTVSQRNVTITFWDHGQQDGDIINIYLNGKLLQGNIELKTKKSKFNATLNSGSNTFEVEAVNEGSVPPNTASVRISNVTQGRSTQIYKRKSGQKASMNLFAP